MPSRSIAAILVGLAALAAVTVHYAERSLLPFVETVRTSLYGEQTYSSALQGCSSLDDSGSWVHPTTLALTVYGETQRILSSEFGRHGAEVLPDDAAVFAGVHELLCVADLFLATAQPDEIDGKRVRRIIFDIPQSTYQLSSGWVSGLAQGMTGQVLLAAYVETRKSKYLRAALELRNLFLVPVDNGGIRVELSPGSVWYEEYAQSGVRPPLVLNGHLLALDFLYWMYRVDGNPETKALFDSGVRAAAKMIDRFCSWGWSYYDQRLNLATGKYHAFHVRQLKRYEMHDESGALRAARKTMKWQLMVPLGVFQRLLTQPSRLLIFLTGMTFALYVLLFAIARRLCRRQVAIAGGASIAKGC
jgi:hypothetical protein